MKEIGNKAYIVFSYRNQFSLVVVRRSFSRINTSGLIFNNFNAASIGNGKHKMQISWCHIFGQKTFQGKNEKN